MIQTIDPFYAPAAYAESNRQRQPAVPRPARPDFRRDKSPIVCRETQQRFPTLAAATAATGVKPCSVLRSYRTGSPTMAPDGRLLTFARGGVTPPTKTYYRARPVRLVDRMTRVPDGRHFDSVRELARAIGVKPKLVHSAIRLGGRVKGYRVEASTPAAANAGKRGAE